MESQDLVQTSTRTSDTESTMRRNLGLDGASPSSSANDPLKMARQAIRSQVTAREYAERQLAQAQNAIQELRGKLRHVYQERDAAVNAVQSAMVAKDAAERMMRAAESALAAERARRIRTEGMSRDAEATIRDLREKLAIANQNLHTTRAELSAERLARQSANDGVIVVPSTIREGGLPVVRRPVGRPRKIVAVEPVQTAPAPSEKPPAMVSPNVDAAGANVRRPRGRPRKTKVATEQNQTSTKLSGKVKLSDKAHKPKQMVRNRGGGDDQEPVQWWVDGWKGR